MLKKHGKGPKMKSVDIRTARKADFDQLCGLFYELHASEHNALPQFFTVPSEIVYKKNAFQAAFEQKDEIIFVAEMKRNIIGTVHARIHKDKHTSGTRILKPRKYGFIENLVVDKSWRKHGIGHQLLWYAEQWLRDQGMKEAELVVWEFNHDAQMLYKKIGYEPLNYRMYKKLR